MIDQITVPRPLTLTVSSRRRSETTNGDSPGTLPPSIGRTFRGFRHYLSEVRTSLDAAPGEWGRHQTRFNERVDDLFGVIRAYEREQLAAGNRDEVDRLKSWFRRYVRAELMAGEYAPWSLRKPFGYAGDHKIIEDIYENTPGTTGFDRLADNYFMMSAIAIAVRNRKDDFKRFLRTELQKSDRAPFRIMDLGCGPSRHLWELFHDEPELCTREVVVDCVDNDPAALDYSRRVLATVPRVSFNHLQVNAVRMALRKDIRAAWPKRYHVIFSTGLFDYLNDRVTTRLMTNLRLLLERGGVLGVSDVRDRGSNPSVHYMEWVGEWELTYRSDDRFRELFVDAGFESDSLSIGFEQQGILQYVFARNSTHMA